MNTLKLGTWLVAASIILTGCGGGSSSSGNGPQYSPEPTDDHISQAQQGDQASEATGFTIDIATDTIVDQGNGPALSKAGSGGGELRQGSEITLSNSVDITLDLDTLDGEGNDLFPNATGVIKVAATGTVTGSEGNQEVDYSVEVTALADTRFTDPENGNQVQFALGSTIAYALHVETHVQSEVEWSISASADASVSGFEATIWEEGQTVFVTLDGERHATAEYVRSIGGFSANATLNSYWEISLSNGEESHDVILEVVSLEEAYVTVDGETYGPFTAPQLLAIFDIDLGDDLNTIGE